MLESLMKDPQTALLTFFGVAVVSGFLFDLLLRLALKLRDMGRTWIVTVPTVPGALGTIERIRLKRDQWTKTHPSGDEKETMIAASAASFPTNRGPMQLITGYGANLVAPTKDEAIAAGEWNSMREQAETAEEKLKAAEDGSITATKEQKQTWQEKIQRYVRFRVADPLIYWRATQENDMEDMYAAQREKEHWAIKLAPVAIIMFVALFAFVGFVLWKILPLLQHAASGAR